MLGKIATVLVGVCVGLFVAFHFWQQPAEQVPPQQPHPPAAREPQSLEVATLGSGCFWCSEAVFEQLKGVHSVVAGYSGGHVPNPTYHQVCEGDTGHAEVVQIKFDPKVVSFAELLEVFWQSHDPTTKNRQGPDEGTQYRSVIFFHNDSQRKLASEYKDKLDQAGAFSRPIVTEIVSFTEFFQAETYHQDYFANNSSQPYCRSVIRPKIDKVRKVFADKLKTSPRQ